MILSEKEIRDFETYLFRNEKEAGTIRTYLTVVRQFVRFLDGRELERDLVIDYKAKIISENAPSTVNSKIGPVNLFLRFLQHPEMCIKRLRIQRQMYCPDEKQLSYDEYLKLIQVSEQQGNYRMSLALQILGSTGIRIGELKYITLEAAKIGRCVVRNKGKTRIVLLPDALRGKIILYAKSRGITSGPVIRTSSGKPVDRINMWRYMNRICLDAGIDPEKGHPHALRHLFAVTHYRTYKDPIGLANLLGHSDINTTRIYTTTDGKAQMEQLNNMNLVT